MVMSMDAPGKHNGSVGHEVDRYMSERYEHYLAEHEVDEAQEPATSPEADIVTPLASEKTTNDDAATLPNEHPSRSNTAEYEDKYKMRNASLRYAMPHSNSLSMEGYFGPYQPRSTPCSRRGMGPHSSSNPSSCGSLHGLSDREIHSATHSPVRRAVSTKSNPGHSRVRSTSHPKITSLSQPPSKRPSYSDQLVYPEQSLASLQASNINARPHPVLRTRSSHPAQNLLYNEMSKASKMPAITGFRTADNTPISSPGLFSPSLAKQSNINDNRPNTSQLHHLQTPKETHTAEIEHDVYSGNKFINSYEVVGELGRGEHGKVKLGRDIERHGHAVAIKIVPRYSAKRRLGKLGAPEDRTKREVAILKKARHPNVVSLLEVIDDPNKNKVYLILEYVDKGEIKWRKHGVKEILAISNQRFEQEKLGINLGLEPTERDAHIVHQAHVRHDRLENLRQYNQGLSHVPNWSLEYAGDTDDESDILDISRSISRQYSHVNSPIRGNSGDEYHSPGTELPLSGSMYGSYMPEAYRHRKFSIANSAISHMSSEMNFDQDDDQRSFVPALTLEEARRAFRDTLLGLEFLHFIGIIHRDIKPANLLVSSSGAVKISDFGVSHLGSPITEEESERKTTTESDVAPLNDEKELARSVGTPAFWAPELCYETTDLFDDKKEPKITGALDLWALGITLYCMIYARLPFYHSQTIGIHEAVCTTEVFCPKTRLVPVDTTSPDPVSRPKHSINSNKRLDYELKFEHIPDTLRDLITKLLVKDPAHRITIAEAKKHPWVTEGLPDTEEFLQNPEMARQSKKKILEISDKEIDRAVVKRSFVEKISNTAGRIVGSLLGRKDTRKRASTNVSSAGSSTDSLHSPAGSSTSTVGKGEKSREPRRPSLRGDELLQALKASRDPSEHHPLAQSQTASPDGNDSSQPTSPGYFDQYIKAASTGATPSVDHERQSRPKGPDRAVSALSTAESVKTIRASNYQRLPLSELTSNPDMLHNELSLRTRVEGLWEGTTKTLTRLASRDRRRGTSGRRSGSRPKSENDGHAGPSLAVSNTHATGAFQTPNALRATDPEIEEPSTVPLGKEIEELHNSPFRVPSSDHVVFEQAQQMNQRRQLQESLAKTDTIASTSSPDQEPNSCPPSPDDLLFNHSAPLSAQISPCDMPARVPSTQPQPSDVPVSAITTAVSASSIATSLDDYGHSSVSQSNSNPSMGIISGSSSPPGEITMFGKHKDTLYENEYDYKVQSDGPASDIMSTADTATIHGRPATPTALGKPLQDEQDYYDDGDDESESSDEEGIVMGGPRKG